MKRNRIAAGPAAPPYRNGVIEKAGKRLSSITYTFACGAGVPPARDTQARRLHHISELRMLFLGKF